MGSQERQGVGNSGGGSFSLKGAVFEESSARAIKLAHRRKWTALGTIFALILIGVGALIYHNVTTNRERDLVREFLAIEGEFTAESERFQQKVQSAGAAAADLTPEYGPIADKFAAFGKEHVNKAVGWQASIRAANIYLSNKKIDEARQLLEPLVKRTLSYNLMQIKIRRALAGIYAEQKNFDKALAELDYLEKLPDNPSLNEIKLFKAQVLYMADKKEEAAKRLRELSDNALAGFDPSARSTASEAAMWLGYWGL